MAYLGMGQNLTARGPQVLVIGSIGQGSVLGTLFLTHSHLAGRPTCFGLQTCNRVASAGVSGSRPDTKSWQLPGCMEQELGCSKSR